MELLNCIMISLIFMAVLLLPVAPRKNCCDFKPCKNNGTCTDCRNGYFCTCQTGYTDTHCGTDINDCEFVNCQNEGTCIDGVNSFSCQCQQGYTGTYCETDVNDCVGVNCQNGGTCIDGVNAFSCQCQQGYTGTYCETELSCGNLSNPVFGTVTLPNGTTTGATAVYECAVPLCFDLIGPTTRTCQNNGNWSDEEPYCQIKGTELTFRNETIHITKCGSTWDDMKTACELFKKQGQLVKIDNSDLNDFIWANIFSSNNFYYIGGKRNVAANEWVWLDETAVAGYWKLGQPDGNDEQVHSSPDANCLAASGTFLGQGWFDLNCEVIRSAICQIRSN